MLEHDFGALLTFDKNLQHQQNFQKFPITVFILTAPNNTYKELSKLSSKIIDLLDSASLNTGIVIVSK